MSRLVENYNVSFELFIILSKTSKFIMDLAKKDMKKYDMSPSEFMILEVLYTKGCVPLQQVWQSNLVSSGSITYNIDKLEEKGLLLRIPSKEDRRVIYAKLTENGHNFFDHIFQKHSAGLHSILSSLNDDEKQLVIHLLKKLGQLEEG
ncbi:MarR family winged helix-turn-helix transcriptional regulator [Bacillus horti]|uniref:MarR family 2-MHQ and catechol resistance regulon transcriptional repressor n=1 Tax=Caldalkalibacillus horti TaxID=77523 RepID=A0ABT9W1P2_9BACI|nr:MarR family transcriptional regulator [Bacillus horti]MDQ0167030.1 MarR family 2-MHQ and catechol resistance regulon transcriptional repressor [Bacillus horti]